MTVGDIVMKILAIDDKRDNLVTLTALLRNLMPECTVITALSGVEGIQKAVDDLPDTVLLDVNMPGLDGFETCRKLKNDERTRSIPIIMITAVRTDAKSRIKGFEVGADAFLSKPIDEYEVVSQIRVALRVKAAEDALRQERDSLETMVRERTAELRKSEEKLSGILQNVTDVVWSLSWPDLEVLFISPAVEAVYGRPAKEFYRDKTLWRKVIHPEDEHTIEKAVGQLTETGVAERECRIVRPDGSVIWIHVRSRMVFDKNGRPVKVNGITADISGRKRAENELREREAFIRTVMDYLPIGIAVNSLDPDVTFNYMNDNFPKIYRTTRQALENPGAFWDVVYEDPVFREEIKNRVLRDCAGGDPDRMYWEDVPVTRKGEETFFISACNIPMPESGLVISTVWDVTKRKQAEEEKEKLLAQLFQAQKLESVGRLAGGVAHDYNNMLAIITGYAEMAMSKVPPSNSLHADLREILNAAGRSTQITRQLLAFARKQTVAPVVLEMNGGVEGMLKMLRRLIGEDIDLRWQPGVGLWPIKMDPTQLDQILANLCVNARDAIDGVGEVTIETSNATFDEAYCAHHAGFTPGDFVMLVVSDDGCGMDKTTLENIFEPFFTTKSVHQGSGLGLATVFGIVKQNEGFINVYSEPGKGTTFRIYLPRHVGEVKATRNKAAGGVPLGRGETVLLVEDEPAMIKMGRMMLEKLGYAVLTADTPGKALRLAEEHTGKIDLLITDVVMPTMNGRELAKRLHALYPNTKIIYMSGYTADVIAHRGVLEKDVNFVQKPFSMKDLGERVREVLDGA